MLFIFGFIKKYDSAIIQIIGHTRKFGFLDFMPNIFMLRKQACHYQHRINRTHAQQLVHVTFECPNINKDYMMAAQRTIRFCRIFIDDSCREWQTSSFHTTCIYKAIKQFRICQEDLRLPIVR